MRKTILLYVLAFAAITSCALAQQALPPTNACGDSTARFEVKASAATDPAQPEPGKALVFFIEKDMTTRIFATPTTRVGVDGQWLGATHGSSHVFFSVDPGVHHVCAYTQFGGVGGEAQAFSHFTAEAGGVYYFEVKNARVGGSQWSDDLEDVSLLQPDQDEGRYLASSSPLVTAQRKK